MYFFNILVSCVFIYGYAAEDDFEEYRDAQVWRTYFRVKNREPSVIRKLSERNVISLWSMTPKSADYLVFPQNKLEAHRLLKEQDLNHSVIVMDVRRRMLSQKVINVLWDDNTLRLGHRLNLDHYPTLEIIDEYLDYIKENFPSICKIKVIGRTYENRTIKAAMISNGNPRNKVILITAGMHAREWIAITSALYLLDGLVSKYDQLPEYIKDKDWIVVPVLNPDGFKYTITHDRLWRKNRRHFTTCTGVDINRNFETDWDDESLRVKDECHNAYSGPNTFSEAESQALRNLVRGLDKKPSGHMDLHSYGKILMYPWAGKTVENNETLRLQLAARKIIKAIYNATGETYITGPAYRTVYPAAGTGSDWMYSEGVNLTFAMEAGSNQYGGFFFPPSTIKTIGKEVLAAVKALAKIIDPKADKQNTDRRNWF